MMRAAGYPFDSSHPAAAEHVPSATVRFRSGRTVTVVHPEPDRLLYLWRDYPGSLGSAPGAPRLLVVRERWTHRPSWPEFDVTIDLNAIEAIQVHERTAPERQAREGSPPSAGTSNPHGLGVMPCADEKGP